MLFSFGLTESVNKADRNTFWALEQPVNPKVAICPDIYLQDSLRMMQYLPLHFEPRLVDVHVDRKTIDLAFKI
jgi:type I restriction enzyme R subunit